MISACLSADSRSSQPIQSSLQPISAKITSRASITMVDFDCARCHICKGRPSFSTSNDSQCSMTGVVSNVVSEEGSLQTI